MAGLPYVTAPGNIEKALNGIKSAATPERVTQDFVKTILHIPGGSGDQITSFLKKIGFANSDGTPSSIYKKFRNDATSGQAVAEALKIGYTNLYIRNEYMHSLSDKELKGLIIEETGQSEGSNAVSFALASIKALKKFAEWGKSIVEEVKEMPSPPKSPQDLPLPGGSKNSGVGLNLSYTINLNLPATSDISVFNAIFKSLKDNLLKEAGSE
ncbi:DUF5343 domain-containing protein [Nitrospira sp. MA-1]|nr:DUF5343 domain-containing protein [Nitrospira sp. MA-1]